MPNCSIDWAATAAWAQAIFGAGAVIAAFLVGNSQVRATMRLHRIRQLSLERAAVLAIAGATGTVKRMAEMIESGVAQRDTLTFAKSEHRITEDLAKNAGFPVWEMENLPLAIYYRQSVSQYEMARSYIPDTVKQLATSAAVPSRVAMIWREVAEEMQETARLAGECDGSTSSAK